MAEFQHQVKLGYSPKEGKWVIRDERVWIEIENIDSAIEYLRNNVKLHMEGEIILRPINGKWYLRDAGKLQIFDTPDEMAEAFYDIANNYEEEVLQGPESLFGKRKGRRGIDMARLQTWMQDAKKPDIPEGEEVPVDEEGEPKEYCAWHRAAEAVAVCTGCDKNLCEACVGKTVEEHVFCNSCWTQYKYARHLEKFKKMRGKK